MTTGKETKPWYFIPDNVSVGIFKPAATVSTATAQCTVFTEATHSDFGFVTCRFKYRHWISQGTFERLTGGYRPSNQRDCEAQLKKTITGAVMEIRNEPVDGFKLVSWRANPYQFAFVNADKVCDVVLEDPRGFCVAITHDCFFKALSMAGMTLTAGVLAGKYCYGWDSDTKAMTLVYAGHAEYANWKKTSDEFKTREKAGYSVSKKELVPGAVYRAKKVLTGDWMYVGSYDTYSQNCHLAAFDSGGQYDVDGFAKKEIGELRQKWHVSWPTTRGKLIFYSMTPNVQQYVIRSDIDGIFSGVVSAKADGLYYGTNGSRYEMYDGSGPVTFARIKNDMKKSPAFNKINFSGNQKYAAVPANVLIVDFWENGNSPIVFPFTVRFSARTIRSTDGKWHKVTSYDDRRTKKEFRVYQDILGKWQNVKNIYGLPYGYGRKSGNFGYYTTKPMTIDEFRKAFSPTYLTYTLENGNALRPEHAVMLVPKEIRAIANSMY